MTDWMAPDAIPQRMQYFLLLALVVITVCFRLAMIEAPSIQRTLWKEIDYQVISENYWKGGYRFLQPEVSWPAEGSRVTAMEFPLVPFVAAIGYALAGQTPLSVRWPTMLAFALLGVFVFLLVRLEWGPIAGLASAAAALSMPLYHGFGNILYSDPSAICMGAASILLVQRWLKSGRLSDAVFVSLAVGLTLALKSEMLYLSLCWIWMVWRCHRWNVRRYIPAVLVAVGALAIAVPWYVYAYWLSQNSRAYFAAFGGLFGGHDLFQTSTMLTDPRWYRAIASRFVSGVLGGPIGTTLAFGGAVALLLLRLHGLILVYLAAVLCHVLIVAEGHLDAPYRQLHAIPPLAALVGLGALGLVAFASIAVRRDSSGRTGHTFWTASAATVVTLALALSVPIQRLQHLLRSDPAPAADQYRWRVASKVKELAGEGSLLVTVGEYTIHKGGVDISPVLYRYADARGWSLIGKNWSIDQVDTLRDKGAVLFVGLDLDREPEVRTMVEQLVPRYRVVYREAGTVIIDLR